MTGTSSRLLLAAALGAGSLIAGCAIACTTPAASGALMRLASPATPTATPNTTVPPKLWGPILPEPPVEDPQISAYVREVYQDRAGHYWFGTNGDGVARFDGTSLTYPSFGPGFDGLAVRGIDQHADGSMWFATDAGVTRIAGDTITNFTMKDGLSSIQVWSLMIDRAGTVWAGTHEGVCRFDGTAFVSFPLPRIAVATPESRFTPKVVFAMEEDAAGHLWFGTDGEGVHRFDGAGFTSFSQADGLGSNMVRSLRSDRAGRMWVGTDGGGVSVLESGRWRTLTMA
ncbi:MAG: two-component regulator propeller domain-containing protein, partial [Phycisphaerales bacterium]